MTREKDEILVRDLGSTNGIRINGQRVESGRLKPGDELSVAHIRYKFQDLPAVDVTLADGFATMKRPETPSASMNMVYKNPEMVGSPLAGSPAVSRGVDGPLAEELLRKFVPVGVPPEDCRIQVIVQVQSKDGLNALSPSGQVVADLQLPLSNANAGE